MDRSKGFECGLIAIIVAGLLVVVFVLINIQSRDGYIKEESSAVEAGQIWVYKNDNPFKDETTKYIVLEVRGEWVKFVNEKYVVEGDGFHHTDRIEWFSDRYVLQVPKHK